jgi:phage gp36-like protein
LGTYIEQTHIEDVFGVENVARWSNLENESADADTGRIALAIAKAEQEVHDRFRGGRYTLPFTGSLSVVRDWCAKLAGAWLYSSRGARASDADEAGSFALGNRRAALEEMDLYLAGARRLDSPLAGSWTTDAPMVV